VPLYLQMAVYIWRCTLSTTWKYRKRKRDGERQKKMERERERDRELNHVMCMYVRLDHTLSIPATKLNMSQLNSKHASPRLECHNAHRFYKQHVLLLSTSHMIFILNGHLYRHKSLQHTATATHWYTLQHTLQRAQMHRVIPLEFFTNILTEIPKNSHKYFNFLWPFLQTYIWNLCFLTAQSLYPMGWLRSVGS